jgi:hypothetical protein
MEASLNGKQPELMATVRPPSSSSTVIACSTTDRSPPRYFRERRSRARVSDAKGNKRADPVGYAWSSL